jgi:hypothetical protein
MLPFYPFAMTIDAIHLNITRRCSLTLIHSPSLSLFLHRFAVPPVYYTQTTFRDVGKSLLYAVLEEIQENCWSRLPKSRFRSRKGLLNSIKQLESE